MSSSLPSLDSSQGQLAAWGVRGEPPVQWWRVCFLTAVMIVLTLAIAAWNFPRHWADSANYIAMAQGQQVMAPWGARILLPMSVSALMAHTGLSLDQSFAIATISAFIVWISVVGAAWRPSVWLPFFLVTPFVVACVRVVYITDMFHMGMTALFFALLRWRPLAAALFVIPLICARESSMFLAFIAAGFLIWRGDRIAGAAMLVCYLAGTYLVHRASAGIENVHHMPAILYLFTKIPANFLRNWVGVELWTDGYAWCDQPFVTLGLPLGIHFGAITRIGICTPSIARPIATLSYYVTLFGVMPAMLWAALRRGAARDLWRDPWWGTTFIYGALMLLLGPLAGAPADREIGFGWTIFYLALPAVCVFGLTWKLAALNVLACWSPVVLSAFLSRPDYELSFMDISIMPIVSMLALAIGLVANVAAARLLREIATQDAMPAAAKLRYE